MPGPGELVDRLNPVQPVSAVDQDAGVARESRGVAGDRDRPGHPGDREHLGLRPGAGARRIEDHGVKARELGGEKRPLVEIAFTGHLHEEHVPEVRAWLDRAAG